MHNSKPTTCGSRHGHSDTGDSFSNSTGLFLCISCLKFPDSLVHFKGQFLGWVFFSVGRKSFRISQCPWLVCPIWMAKSISVIGLLSSHSPFLILCPRLYWNSPNSLWSCPVQTSQLPACGERRRWNGPTRKLGDCLPVCLSVCGFSFPWLPLRSIMPWTLCFSVPFLHFTRFLKNF